MRFVRGMVIWLMSVLMRFIEHCVCPCRNFDQRRREMWMAMGVLGGDGWDGFSGYGYGTSYLFIYMDWVGGYISLLFNVESFGLGSFSWPTIVSTGVGIFCVDCQQSFRQGCRYEGFP